jgi:hypothetical protein
MLFESQGTGGVITAPFRPNHASTAVGPTPLQGTMPIR